MTRPRITWARLRRRSGAPALPLRAFLHADFPLLAERPPFEIALGLMGRFWLPVTRGRCGRFTSSPWPAAGPGS